MLPAEALKALRSTPDLALLIDRRGPSSGRGPAIGLTVDAVVDLPGGPATAYLVRASDLGPLPARLTLGTQTVYVRLMDRFYVPTSPSTAVVSALFDLIADLYDEIVGYNTNLETAQHLLSLVLETARPAAEILDFGCGTGVAREALGELKADARIIGTDLSAEMLRRAEERGEETLTIDHWRADARVYDGAIACFVLHYGVPDADLERIANSLVPGGRFATNFFKAEHNDIERFIGLMTQAGLKLVHFQPIPSATTSQNPVLVFERPTC